MLRIIGVFSDRKDAENAERIRIASDVGNLCNLTAGGDGLSPEDMRKLLLRPDVILRRKEGQKRRWSNPNEREHLSKKLKEVWTTAERLEKHLAFHKGSKRPGATSKFVGVSRLKNDRWRARHRDNGKVTDLGCFDTEEAAATAVKQYGYSECL